MFSPCETDYNLERHLIPFLQNSAFYTELSRQLHKVHTAGLPTAAVAYNPQTDEITLYTNPVFMASLSNWETKGVLTHEFNHLVFGHLSARRKTPGRLWNVATDLAINSLIVEHAERPRDLSEGDVDDRPLPRFALVPGCWPTMPDGRELSKEEKEGAKLGQLIAGFPKLKASEWYFHKLQEAAEEERKKRGSGGGAPGDDDGDDWLDSFDDHDAWDEISDEQREYIEGKVKSMVERAVNYADQSPTGWGSMPADLVADIRRSVSTVVNWRTVLRQFVGTLIRGSRTTSIKRINRRYPYIHPGIKRGWQAKLLIAMDQSGSVYNEMVEEFFGELSSLTKKVDISILPFDCYCSEKDIVEWRKGASFNPKRTKAGGTDFNAPTRIFNDPKNRGRWDGMLIMTDGCAPPPDPVRAKRGWVLGKGCKLMWETTELQIFLSKEQPMSGAWR